MSETNAQSISGKYGMEIPGVPSYTITLEPSPFGQSGAITSENENPEVPGGKGGDWKWYYNADSQTVFFIGSYYMKFKDGTQTVRTEVYTGGSPSPNIYGTYAQLVTSFNADAAVGQYPLEQSFENFHSNNISWMAGSI